MIFKFSLLAAALLNAVTVYGDESSAATNHQAGRDLSAACANYDIQFPVTTEGTILWTGGGGSDREWINKDNWQYAYLPGVSKSNRLVLANNDRATVHCDATYMVEDIYLEARAGATLDVTADLNIGDQLMLKTEAAVTQSSASTVTLGKNLHMAATGMYSIADMAQLSIALNLYMAINSKLTIIGDSTSIAASEETTTESQIHGEVKFVLGPTGTGTFDLKGPLSIGSDHAKIIVDASAYTDGTKSIPLIKFTSVDDAFAPSNIITSGLSAGMTARVESRPDGIYLEMAGPGVTPGTPAPFTPTTPYPIQSPVSNSPIIPGSPTAPPTKKPTNNPTPIPTKGPIPAPTTPKPVSPPTPAPTTPKPVSPPTPPPVDLTGTRITLSQSGTGSTCPAQDATSVVIDGAAYVGGPGTIIINSCSFINANYDLMNIRVENFAEGLWFEIKFNAGSIDLIIKSLANYKEYWNRVKNTFDVAEYSESPNTAHFPKFSWDTIPTWVRYRKNLNKYSFDNEELESIATNHHLSWYGLGTPDHVKDIMTRIKAYNPDHRTMLYWNAESYWGTSNVGFNDAWLKPAVGTGDRVLYDHTIPAMRDWWVNHAKTMATHPAIDGVFTDNTLSPECDNAGCLNDGLSLETTIKSLMVKRLAEELPADVLDVGNYLRQYYDTGNRFRMEYADGSYFENQHKTTGIQSEHEGITVSMQMAREASWKKKVVMWTGSRRNCGCGFDAYSDADIAKAGCTGFNKVPAGQEPTLLLQQDLEKSLGEFLMIVEEFSYINFNVSPDANCERWRWDSSGLAEFNRPLGRPLGPPLKSGNVFSRHFENLSVKMDLATETATLIWK